MIQNIHNIITRMISILIHMSSEKTKRIYQEENKEMMKFLIEKYVGYLKKTTHGKRLMSSHINLEIILIVVIIMILSYQR